VKTWTKEEVLDREELTADELKGVKHFRVEEGFPTNQFWDGGKCYVPVIYMGRAYKCRQRIKSEHQDN
jgi:hypothetical protein